MNRSSHIVYGTCAMTAVVALAPTGLKLPLGVNIMPLCAAPMVIFGAYLSDIDVKTSGIRKKWKAISVGLMVPVVLLTVALLLQALGKINVSLLSGVGQSVILVMVGIVINCFLAFELKHRTLTHSWYFPVLTFLSMCLVTTNASHIQVGTQIAGVAGIDVQVSSLLFGLLVGILSHLFADSCTDEGTYLAYPIPFKIHLLPKFLRVTTGTASERVFTGLVVAATSVFVLWRLLLVTGLMQEIIKLVTGVVA